jgi:hypothetical protein
MHGGALAIFRRTRPERGLTGKEVTHFPGRKFAATLAAGKSELLKKRLLKFGRWQPWHGYKLSE